MNISLVRLPLARIVSDTKQNMPYGIGYISAMLKTKPYFNVSVVDGETFTYFKDKLPLVDKYMTKVLPMVTKAALRRLKSVMENENHDFWKLFVKKILDTKPDLIGISAYSQNITAVNIITKKLKASLPDIPIVLGGPHATVLPEWTLERIPSIDYIICGEGEYRLLNLCELLYKKQFDKLDEVDSLYRRINNKPTGSFNLKGGLISDLDSLPYPDPDLRFELKHYRSGAMWSVPIIAGRGCPYNCSFCASKTISSKKVRYRKTECIIAEMSYISQKAGAKRFALISDTMTTSKSYFLELCEKLRNYKSMNWTFSINSRANEVNEEMVKTMNEVGCDSVGIGVESGSERILRSVDKDLTIKEVKDAVNLFKKYKIHCTCHFIIGHPGEKEEDIIQTLQLAKELSGKTVNVTLNLATPYPGTPWYQSAQEKGYEYDVSNLWKLFHQGDIQVNMTDMDDKTLNYWYKKGKRVFRFCQLKTNIFRIYSKLRKIYLRY